MEILQLNENAGERQGSCTVIHASWSLRTEAGIIPLIILF